jgi:hypothetical protein
VLQRDETRIKQDFAVSDPNRGCPAFLKAQTQFLKKFKSGKKKLGKIT